MARCRVAGNRWPGARRRRPVANLLGKRYTCEECGAQVLVTKAGDGVLACHDRSMEVMQPKPLPSSD